MQKPGKAGLPAYRHQNENRAPVFHKGPTVPFRYGKLEVKAGGFNKENKGRYNFYSRTINIGTTVKLLVGPSLKRAFLQIQNLSANDVYLGYGSSPATSGINSEKLVADAVQSFTDLIVPSNEIYAISSASSLVSIIEGVPIE